MTPGAPRVCVVVTAYQQAETIAEAVASALQQTLAPVEVVVVDDGSTDATSRLLSDLARQQARLRVLAQDNAGACAARNAGAAATSAEWLCFLDGDDRLRPEALAVGVRAAQEAGADFACGRSWLVDGAGRALPTTVRPPVTGDLYAELLRAPWLTPPAVLLVARSALEAVGGWDASLRFGGDDLDLYLRLARTSRGVDHAAVVCDYRVHTGNRSSDYRRCLADNLAVYERQRAFTAADPALERARTAGVQHYRRAFLTKAVLRDLQEAVRARRGRAAAAGAAAAWTLQEPRAVVRIVRHALSRRGRAA